LIHDGYIGCKERFKEMKDEGDNRRSRSGQRKCLLIYDETKLRNSDNEKIQIPLIRRYFPGYMAGDHKLDILYSNKKHNITFLVQCLSIKKPYWFVLFTENFDHSTTEILRDQLKYCIANIKLLGLELENIVSDLAPHHLPVRKYFPEQNFSFDLLHCLDNVIEQLVKNSLKVNDTKLNLNIIKKLKFDKYQCFQSFFLTPESSGSITYQENKGIFFFRTNYIENKYRKICFIG
jgi:hypothetical protein